MPNNKHFVETGETLAKKLGVKSEGMPLAILWEPDGFGKRLGLDEDGYETDLILGKHDLIIIFTGSRVVLRECFPIAIDRLEPSGRIWIAWPRKNSNQKTDLTAEIVLSLAESFAMIEIKRGTIETEWNGIKFKKGTQRNAVELERMAPYAIGTFSSIPISNTDSPKEM